MHTIDIPCGFIWHIYLYNTLYHVFLPSVLRPDFFRDMPGNPDTVMRLLVQTSALE